MIIKHIVICDDIYFQGADPVEGVAALEDQAAVSSWAAFASGPRSYSFIHDS